MPKLDLTEAELECILIGLGESRKIKDQRPAEERRRAYITLRRKAWGLWQSVRAWKNKDDPNFNAEDG